MIIKQLINFWRDDSALKGMFSEFNEMLVIAKDMFERVTKNLFDPSKDMEAESKEVVKLDGRLNALQQIIRRDIVMHITVQGSKDILPCLLLMSIVKDAERLGDYAKNILEIGERFKNFEKGEYFDKLKSMQKNIILWFDETKTAFAEIDEKRASETQQKFFGYEKECDRIAWELINTQDKKDAVALALLFRFFKRILAHLGNICTSVTMPLDKLDYYDEG